MNATQWQQARRAAALECRRDGLTPLVANKTGAQSLQLAEMLLDLYDLAHMACWGNGPVNMLTLQRIRGADPLTAERAFYRMRDWLAEHGVAFEKRAVEGEQSVRIEFEVEEIRAVLRGEIQPACGVLETFRKRTGRLGRLPERKGG